MEEIFKIELKKCDALNESAYGKDEKYISLQNGYVLVKKRDLDYIFNNYEVLSAEYIGKLYKGE